MKRNVILAACLLLAACSSNSGASSSGSTGTTGSSAGTTTGTGGSNGGAGTTGATTTSGSTGATTGGSTGATTGGSTGATTTGTSSGTGGGGSLTGQNAFTVNLALEELPKLSDGGIDPRVAVGLLSDYSATCADLQAAADAGQRVTPTNIKAVALEIFSLNHQVTAGLYQVHTSQEISNQFLYGDAGIDLDGGIAEIFWQHIGDDGGVDTQYAGQGGTVDVSALGTGGMQATFDTTLFEDDGGPGGALSGTIDAPYCGQ